MKRINRVLLWVVVFTFIFGLLPAYGATTLKDIQGHWAQREIESLVAQGIIKGYPDGTFRPDQAVTRAEFSTLMVSAIQLPLSNPAVPTFADVPRGSWCYQYVETAAAQKLVEGWGGSFYPNYGISHEQAATLLIRALGKAGEADQYKAARTNFTDDAKLSDWARGSVVLAAQLGIISAYSDGSFKPQQVTTRAEMAVFMYRFLALYRPSPSPVAAPTLTWARYDSRDDLLTLTFDRTIAISSVDVTKIAFQFNDESRVYFLDTRSKVRTYTNSSVIEIGVVGLAEPATVQKATIWLYAGAVKDLQGTPNQQISSFLQYISYTDTARPELKTVRYDRDNNELTLYFSEQVLKNTVDLDEIKAYRIDAYGDVWIVLQDLVGGRVTVPAGDYGDTVEIELTSSDASNLEYYLDRGRVYLVLKGVKDRAGNEMVPLEAARKEGVEIEGGETVSGELELESGNYDSDRNRLTLNFDRTIDIDSVRLSRIALRFNSTSNSFWYLDEADCDLLTSSDSSRIVIKVDEDAVHEPSSVSRAWVKLEDGAVRDLAGRRNSEVIKALSIDDDFEEDTPVLEEATYDPGDNVLVLEFGKRLKEADLSQIKLWAKKSDGSVKWVIPLNRSADWYFDNNRYDLWFRLWDDDAYWVESERQVWVRVEAGAVKDYDGNRNAQQDVTLDFESGVPSSVIISQAVITDRDGSGTFNWDDTIDVTFSDSIQVSGLRVSHFRLNAGGDFGTGARVAKTKANAITIYLGDDCRITPELLYNKVYLVYDGDSVYDKTGRLVKTCQQRLKGYESTGPKISDARYVDYNNDRYINKGDEIKLTFNEPVVTASGAYVKIASGASIVTAELVKRQGKEVWLEVTGGSISASYSQRVEFRFDQGAGDDLVIIDVYGNVAPVQSVYIYRYY
ncbi:MAG: S-layer homology domain-containing protein [Bacillota bacterium]|nr:S-layer homology domain-containing protein [Bacillota bacterium]